MATPLTPPQAGDDVLNLRPLLTAVVQRLNSISVGTVNPKGSKNKIVLSDGNFTIELNKDDLGGGTGGGGGNALPEHTVTLFVNGVAQDWVINGRPAS